MNPYLSVVIPAYNESKTITDTMGKILMYLKQNFSFEIIIVNDGSADRTAQVVESNFTSEPAVKLINRQENRGKGFTVREGMLAARGSIRLMTDADNATDIFHFDLMKPLFDSGYGVVIGSRDPKDAPGARQVIPQSWFKRLLGDAGNLFTQIMAVPGIWDTQCGFKAFTADAAEKIFKVAKTDGWAFDAEVLALARLFGYKIGIIPVQWVNNPDSRVKLSTYLEVLLAAIKLNGRIRSLKRKLPASAQIEMLR